MDVERKDLSSAEVASRLEKHPVLKTRMLRLLDLVENTGGDLKRADDAEERAIDELRALGQEILQDWGQRLSDEEAMRARAEGGVVHQVKKTPLA